VPRSHRRTRSKPVREKPKTRKPITRTEKPEAERGRRQERRGVVVSDKSDKTIVVKVDLIKSHPKYKKVVRSTVKFHAHDEAHAEAVQPRRRNADRVRRERCRAHRQPERPPGHAHLRACRPRAAREELHEDREPGSRGAVNRCRR